MIIILIIYSISLFGAKYIDIKLSRGNGRLLVGIWFIPVLNTIMFLTGLTLVVADIVENLNPEPKTKLGKWFFHIKH